ncbi:syndecan isoform X1 [Cotesia glomerata]|uniref:syndecan isoform X1 n=2 Tax=Cotesia glomerata TaxID=32391 RepID=UPI001D023904|nr:syndecan isoform X1 [Cotesia glomerata]
MRPRIYWIVACALVFGEVYAAVNEKDTSGKERSIGSTTYNSSPDDLYLDDQDALEGSGRGEVRDDLEASGSGYGPDDEDGDGSSHNPFREHDTNKLDTPPKPDKSDRPVYVEDVQSPGKDSEDLAPPKINKENNNNDVNVSDKVDREEDSDQDEDTEDTHEVLIMNPKHEDRTSSFFAQPGVLAAVIGGAVVGLLCAILVVMFIVYRMRKKDEGSYALDEPRRSPAAAAYPKAGAPHHNREFYA